VFFGMAGVTGFGLLYTPSFYVLLRKFSLRMARRKGGKATHDAAWQPAE
jgi:hypothetical protein